jgi:UDP-N-acetyl-D-mannosaminuronic acid dehydrogenase
MDNSADTSLIEAGRAMNNSMASHVVSLLEDAVGSLANTKIAILGVAYKGNVSDSRNSPGLEVAELLRTSQPSEADSPTIALTDPYVSDDIYNIQELDAAVAGADCVVVVTDHDEYTSLDPDQIATLMSGNTIVDTRNVLDTEAWTNSGFELVKL